MAILSLSNTVLAIIALWLLIAFVEKVSSVRCALKKLGGCPGGATLLLHPFRTAAIVFGPFYPFAGQIGHYFGKFSVYEKYRSTCLGSVTFWGSIPTFWLSDADASRVVSTDRVTFQKDVEAYETLNIYGNNLIGTEGSDWKRHRAVAKPSFNESNNGFVWSETMRITNEWFDQIDASQEKQQKEPTIDLVTDLTQATLLVISSAGFGRRVSWTEDSTTEPPTGHTRAFRPAVTSAVDNMFTKVLTPDWIHNLSQRIYIPFLTPLLKETRESFDVLRFHMLDLISLARAWVSEGKSSLTDAAILRNLVEANMMLEDGYRCLTDDELLLFLLAGHETTSHSLSFAIALLAVYPDVQRKIYEEVSRLWPGGSPLSATSAPYKEFIPKLGYTAAVFNETLRLFPPVARLGKLVHMDTTLKARRFTSPSGSKGREVEEFSVPVPAGSLVIIDVFGVHMNPIHWGEDVDEFKPERFIDTDDYCWPRDAFFAFSAGPRSCIGQRFAVSESVCLLANLVHRYEILVPEELQLKSREHQKSSLLQWTTGPTIKPTNCRVRLRRRH